MPDFIRDNKGYWKGRAKASGVDELMKKASLASSEVSMVAKTMAKKFNGYTTPIHLKSEQSILRKLHAECAGDISQIKDAVRTTIVISPNKIDECIAYLEKNTKFARVKLQTPDKFMGYSGVLTNVKTKQGILGEIQVNTEKMIYAKEKPSDAIRIIGKKRWNEIKQQTGLDGGLGHKYYEEWRSLKAIPGQVERIKELEKLSNEYYKHFR